MLHLERTGGRRVGEGQLVQTSLLESSIYALNYVASSWLNGEYDYTRKGNSHPLISPYTVFKTSDDQWMVVGVATDLQFRKFCSILDLSDLPDDSRFVTNKERCAN